MTPNIAPLGNVATLLSLTDRVQNRDNGLPGMGLFYGPSGWGKTTAVTIAANDFQAHCVQAKYSWNASYLAETILRELGQKPKRGLPRMVDAIGGHLSDTDRPLIIDDAQYLLRKGMIEVVRDIYESCQTSVILVGEENLPQDLTRWENVHNRILAWEPAAPCSLNDARTLGPYYCTGIDVDDALLSTIVDKANGSTRRVASNLSLVKQFAKARGLKTVSLGDWGNRSLDTGHPPQRPREQQSLAAAHVVSFPPKKVAQK